MAAFGGCCRLCTRLGIFSNFTAVGTLGRTGLDQSCSTATVRGVRSSHTVSIVRGCISTTCTRTDVQVTDRGLGRDGQVLTGVGHLCRLNRGNQPSIIRVRSRITRSRCGLARRRGITGRDLLTLGSTVGFPISRRLGVRVGGRRGLGLASSGGRISRSKMGCRTVCRNFRGVSPSLGSTRCRIRQTQCSCGVTGNELLPSLSLNNNVSAGCCGGLSRGKRCSKFTSRFHGGRNRCLTLALSVPVCGDSR